VIRSEAKVSAYAITTHSSCEIETCRSRCIVGNATFTTVLSSMIMKRPNETANSVHHLRFSSASSTSSTRALTSLSSSGS